MEVGESVYEVAYGRRAAKREMRKAPSRQHVARTAQRAKFKKQMRELAREKAPPPWGTGEPLAAAEGRASCLT